MEIHIGLGDCELPEPLAPGDFREILVAYDGWADHPALVYAVSLCAQHRARLTIVTVKGRRPPFLDSIPIEQVDAALTAEAEAKGRATLAAVPTSISARLWVTEDRRSTALFGEVGKGKFDLIVVGREPTLTGRLSRRMRLAKRLTQHHGGPILTVPVDRKARAANAPAAAVGG